MPDNESESRIGYFRLKFKCLSCKLFFAVLTRHRDEWLERFNRGGIYCDHCGSNDVSLDCVEKEKEGIWQEVTGWWNDDKRKSNNRRSA